MTSEPQKQEKSEQKVYKTSEGFEEMSTKSSNHEERRKGNIQAVIRLQKFGFFLLMKNLELVGFFNDHTILTYRPEKAEKGNKQKIISYVYNHYFREKVGNKWKSEETVEEQCSIYKLFCKDNVLFVRLDNQTVQIFFPKPSQNQSIQHYHFHLTFNNNPNNLNEIAFTENEETKYFSHKCEALSEPFAPFLRYALECFQFILKNSQVSKKFYDSKME